MAPPARSTKAPSLQPPQAPHEIGPAERIAYLKQPHDAVRALIQLAGDGIDATDIGLWVKSCSYPFAGRAYLQARYCVVRIGVPSHFPLRARQYPRMKTAPVYDLTRWPEALVAAVAHELRHQHLTGYVMAFGALVALARRVREGGSWLVRISLAQTGRWLVGRGQVAETELQDVPQEFTPEELERWSMTSDTPVGRLRHLGPVLRLSETPPRWARPSVPLGYNDPVWRARAT